MITIISGTNRQASATEVVSKHYMMLLEQAAVPCQMLRLADLPRDFAFTELYGKRTAAMELIIDQYIAQAGKFLFVIPEYNGSFPGILKVFIDAVPPRLFHDKKAAIIGLSDGHAGNLRGQEHLTGILHYLKMHVHYAKPKLSGMEDLVNENKALVEAATLRQLEDHAKMFIGF